MAGDRDGEGFSQEGWISTPEASCLKATRPGKVKGDGEGECAGSL